MYQTLSKTIAYVISFTLHNNTDEPDMVLSAFSDENIKDQKVKKCA